MKIKKYINVLLLFLILLVLTNYFFYFKKFNYLISRELLLSDSSYTIVKNGIKKESLSIKIRNLKKLYVEFNQPIVDDLIIARVTTNFNKKAIINNIYVSGNIVYLSDLPEDMKLIEFIYLTDKNCKKTIDANLLILNIYDKHLINNNSTVKSHINCKYSNLIETFDKKRNFKLPHFTFLDLVNNLLNFDYFKLFNNLLLLIIVVFLRKKII